MKWSHIVTTSSKSAAAAVLGVVLSGALVLAGITFFALSIAFPFALIVIDQLHAHVSASDLALAERLASYWPLFALASIGFLVAALGTIVKIIQRVSPASAA